MTLLPRLLATQPRTLVLVGGLVALMLLVAVFDGNWFRPALERHLSQSSQRTVRIDDLHLSLNARLQPVVRLRGVHVQNAPWADAQPFVVAGEAQFTFSWLSLLRDVKVVTHLRLVDADIRLARQADGLRNWRLTRPDDRGPPRLRVLRLEPVRSSLHLVHQGVGLTLQTTSTPLAQADGELTQRIGVSGTYRDAAFAGEALAGPVLSLQHTGELFALRGEARSAQTRLHVDGRMADLIKFGGLDAQVKLSGPNLDQLKLFFPQGRWPATAAYQAEARVNKRGDALTVQTLRATLGRSDVAGELRYDQHGERSSVHATLHSQHLHLAELLRPSAPASPAQRLLPQTALPLAPLKQLDATLEWKVDSLQAPTLPPLTGLQLRASLDPAQLQIALQDTRLAGGRLKGQFVLDHQAASPQAQIELHAEGLRLEQIMAKATPIDGPLSGQLKLGGHGPSVAAWLGSASGQLRLTLPSGNLSPGLDAKLGLNAGKLLRSFFASDKPVPIRCGAITIDFANGTGTTRELVLDTAQTRLEGQGNIHLRDESWAMLLTPRVHQSTVLALNSSVLVQGSFRDAGYKLVAREPQPQASGCD